MINNFAGDLLLTDTPDGGDCVIKDGLFEADPAFGAAFYISLFGGNKADSGKVKNRKTWWGNALPGLPENEKIISRFQNFILAKPMTVKNIMLAGEAAKQDLKWVIDEEIADEIITTGQGEGRNRLRLYIEVKKEGQSIYTTDYGVLWEGGINGI
jgi:phage gp46-like protein